MQHAAVTPRSLARTPTPTTSRAYGHRMRIPTIKSSGDTSKASFGFGAWGVVISFGHSHCPHAPMRANVLPPCASRFAPAGSGRAVRCHARAEPRTRRYRSLLRRPVFAWFLAILHQQLACGHLADLAIGMPPCGHAATLTCAFPKARFPPCH